MAKAKITKQQIDELLRSLPVLGNPGPETAAVKRDVLNRLSDKHGLGLSSQQFSNG